MREIKFRAWHEGTRNARGKTIFPPQMLYDEKPGDCLVFKNQGQPVTIMQFTGLRDKNGVEIWEHDILDVERTDSFPMFNKAVVVYSDYYGAFLMQYTNECEPSWIIVKESIRSTDGTAIFEYCTGWPIAVIGNIHENTDLLDSSKVTESVTEGE